MNQIVRRAFDRLIKSGNGPSANAQARKNSADALRIHDERAHVVAGFRIRLEVWHVVADPLLRRFIPPDLFPEHPTVSQQVAHAVVQHRRSGHDHAQFGAHPCPKDRSRRAAPSGFRFVTTRNKSSSRTKSFHHSLAKRIRQLIAASNCTFVAISHPRWFFR